MVIRQNNFGYGTRQLGVQEGPEVGSHGATDYSTF